VSSAVTRVRLGAVSFLNAQPLVRGLDEGPAAERIALSFAVPSALAAQLAAGELDGALLPSIELARIPGLVALPGLSISSHGPSASVLLVSKKPLHEVASVGLDPESRTSNALVQVLFARAGRTSPDFSPAPLDLHEALERHDAVVRIGDKALFEARPAGLFVTDLGEAWTEATSLPFVYAVWALRAAAAGREVYELLHAARRRGSKAIESIAARHAAAHGRDEATILDYLKHKMVYRLGAPEWDGLRTFLAEAARLGLAPDPAAACLATFQEPACETAPPTRTATSEWR